MSICPITHGSPVSKPQVLPSFNQDILVSQFLHLKNADTGCLPALACSDLSSKCRVQKPKGEQNKEALRLDLKLPRETKKLPFLLLIQPYLLWKLGLSDAYCWVMVVLNLTVSRAFGLQHYSVLGKSAHIVSPISSLFSLHKSTSYCTSHFQNIFSSHSLSKPNNTLPKCLSNKNTESSISPRCKMDFGKPLFFWPCVLMPGALPQGCLKSFILHYVLSNIFSLGTCARWCPSCFSPGGRGTESQCKEHSGCHIHMRQVRTQHRGDRELSQDQGAG